MGLLVDGVWKDNWYDTKSTGGKFVRSESQFRGWISKDPNAKFPAEENRYHLYVALACPWAHRALIFRELKGLNDIMSVSVVHPLMLENGWTFDDYPGAKGDSVNGCNYLYEVYLKADPHYTGRVTTPTVWDKKAQTIVSNESADIIRMMNTEFNEITGNDDDYYPEEFRKAIDSINEGVYHRVNNGVYKAGFATSQKPYEEACRELFAELDQLEEILSYKEFLCGERVTEADWRLFTTLVRFDAVYYSHFKCNLRQIKDYPRLFDYMKRLYEWPGIAETINLDHIKTHYYGSHLTINPTGIVPIGPQLMWAT